MRPHGLARARGLNVTEVTEGLTIVELNDQTFASVRKVSYGKQTTTTGQGTASGKWRVGSKERVPLEVLCLWSH